MSGEADNLKKQLQIFEITEEEAGVYIHLLKQGSTTALKLSRDLKTARTKIYRLLEKLIQKGFVKEEIQNYGTKFVAESYEKLNQIIQDKENNLKILKENAPSLFNQLALLQGESSLHGNSKILHYRGVEGLKQVTWNSLKVKDVLRIYEIELMHSFLDQEFSEKVRTEFAKRDIKVHQLTNITKFDDYTSVTAHVKQWELRHIPKKELDIKFEMLIYNNVYCLYEYTEDDVFIIEIYNQKLADMQKQLFDLVWKNAQKMKIISPKGAAVLA